MSKELRPRRKDHAAKTTPLRTTRGCSGHDPKTAALHTISMSSEANKPRRPRANNQRTRPELENLLRETRTCRTACK